MGRGYQKQKGGFFITVVKLLGFDFLEGEKNEISKERWKQIEDPHRIRSFP